LFERSALRGAQRVPQRRPRAEHRRLPAAKRRGTGQWGRLFFAYFLLATQKKVGALPGAHPGLRRLHSDPLHRTRKEASNKNKMNL
ncbi:hypothetical protein, partial [Ottowia sp.]|uniref:hypothetical protein n=1 Tax=Ottowia sp. TaxID=1898956 RepID=UPI00262F85B9